MPADHDSHQSDYGSKGRAMLHDLDRVVRALRLELFFYITLCLSMSALWVWSSVAVQNNRPEMPNVPLTGDCIGGLGLIVSITIRIGWQNFRFAAWEKGDDCDHGYKRCSGFHLHACPRSVLCQISAATRDTGYRASAERWRLLTRLDRTRQCRPARNSHRDSWPDIAGGNPRRNRTRTGRRSRW